MSVDDKPKKCESEKPIEPTHKTIQVQENRFIDAGADSLIWPDKPAKLTEKDKALRDAMIEASQTNRPLKQVLRERGIDGYY